MNLPRCKTRTKLHLPRKLRKHCTIAHFPRSPISSDQTLRFIVAKEERGSKGPSILWPTHHVSASPAVRAVDGWNCATWTRRGASFREDRDGASLLEDDRRGGQPWNPRRQSADGAGPTGRSSIPSRDLEDTDPCSRRLLLRPRLARGSPRPRCPAPCCRRLTSCWLICTTQRKINRALARPFVARNHVDSARVSNLPSGTRHSSRTRARFHSVARFYWRRPSAGGIRLHQRFLPLRQSSNESNLIPMWRFMAVIGDASSDRACTENAWWLILVVFVIWFGWTARRGSRGDVRTLSAFRRYASDRIGRASFCVSVVNDTDDDVGAGRRW